MPQWSLPDLCSVCSCLCSVSGWQLVMFLKVRGEDTTYAGYAGGDFGAPT